MMIALLLVHYVTLALLVFGYVQSIESGAASTLMAWGARLQLLSGLLLVGAAEMGGDVESGFHMFVGIKLLVMLAVLAVTEISHARGRRGQAQPMLLHAAAGLVLVNLIAAYTLPH